MTRHAILIHPDPRLRKSARPVEQPDDALRALANDMLETMYAAPGIGLAAPQVGCNWRLVVLDCGEPARPLVMFNPEIVSASTEQSAYDEGCLSLPEIRAQIDRPAEIDVTWMDRDGNPAREGFAGLWATCIQHEIDHLDGKLFIDYLTPLKRGMITRKMAKLKRERARGTAP